jgi:hypothetical protein
MAVVTTRRGRPAAVRGLAIAMIVAAACGSSGGGGPTETEIEARLREAVGAALGVKVARVACATPASCVATIDGVNLPVAVREDGGRLAWEIAGLVVRAAVLEGEVAAMLAELDVAAKVDCGARVQLAAAGARIACAIAAPVRGGVPVADRGAAWATIEADGAASLELVLGADAVAKRSERVAADELERMSRALDTGDGVDEGEEGSGSGSGGP